MVNARTPQKKGILGVKSIWPNIGIIIAECKTIGSSCLRPNRVRLKKKQQKNYKSYKKYKKIHFSKNKI